VILQAWGIKKEYRRDNNIFRAVNDVSLAIAEGELVCIAGRSGSGKSTLLNILAGLLSPSAGKVSFAGQSYDTLSDNELCRLRGTSLGYIMQGVNILSSFTVLHNVMLPCSFSGHKGQTEDKALALLERMGIGHLAAQYPYSLSGGELRRVAIARALFISPRLVIADEPTGDLDEENSAGIMRLLACAAQNGAAVLLVSHDLCASAYCHRTYTMKEGCLMSGKAAGST
jgi:putative ABC transport system ATP-binding protein